MAYHIDGPDFKEWVEGLLSDDNVAPAPIYFDPTERPDITEKEDINEWDDL